MSGNDVRLVYFAGYQIETTVTNYGAVVNNWVRSFNAGQKRVVGLDCEWKPNNAYTNNRIALLQLCVGTKCLIVQLCYLDYFPQSLVDFLENPNNYFAGVGVDADVAKVNADYGLRLSGTSTADIQTIAMEQWNWRQPPGLKNILYHVEGMVMEKPQHICRSNWQMRVLTEEQVQYACIDAFASYRVGYSLRHCIDCSIY